MISLAELIDHLAHFDGVLSVELENEAPERLRVEVVFGTEPSELVIALTSLWNFKVHQLGPSTLLVYDEEQL